MAERYAVQDGTWQNAATWDGGVIPGEGDDVHAGGFEVTIRDSIKVKSLRTAAGSSAPAGGRFVVGPMDIAPDTRIEVTDGILAAHHQSGNASTSARTYILWVLDAEAEITLVTPTIEGGAGQYRFGVGINVTGTATPGAGGGEPVIIDVSSGAGLKGGGSTQSTALVVDAGGAGQDVTVLGNITGGSGSNADGLRVGGGTVDITGDITGGSGSSADGLSVTGGTVDVTGDITGGSGSSAYGLSVTGGTVDVTGDITGGSNSSAYGLSVDGALALVRIDGTIYASEHTNGLSVTQAPNLPPAIKAAVNHPNGMSAMWAAKFIIWDADEFSWEAYTDAAWPDPEGSKAYLTRFGTDLPQQADVREGTTYGPNGNLTGTLRTSEGGGASLADIAAVTGAQIAAATNQD